VFRQSKGGGSPTRTKMGFYCKLAAPQPPVYANNLSQSLNDFHSTSCFKYFAYGYLWVSLLISVAVYAVDTFTAVNLLAFNRWSGEIKPVISFDISKWIFAGCIIASWVNLGFEHLRAMRVIKRGAVAESYLDSLAVRLQSIRLGQGRGFKRFLVFAELTKSKKGTEYIALFTYFSFQCMFPSARCLNNADFPSLDSNHLLPRTSTSHQCPDVVLSFSSTTRPDRRHRCWINSCHILQEDCFPC
jgi:hypothetical protein